MQISRNLSENVNYKYMGTILFKSISMHLDSLTKVKTNMVNDEKNVFHDIVMRTFVKGFE